MRILWTSPHCRPDWLDRLGEESQGGQTVVMNRLPHALTHTDAGLQIDLFTRLQDDDPHAGPPKFLDGDPRVRLIRLPCGPTDRYVPKEVLYGAPIAEFVAGIAAFAENEGIRYDLLHGHYADGWETVTGLQARWQHRPPTLLTTHSLGRRKQADALARGEGTAEELERKYTFAARIASEETSLQAAERILPLSTPEAQILMDNYVAVTRGDPRLCIVPNGIDPSQFPRPPAGTRQALRAELGLAEETFLLLVPSRVDPRKGQENLLRALATVRKRLTERDFKVLFVAWPDPPTDYALRLEQIISATDLGRAVLTHPPIPHRRMTAFFAAADGVVLPSQEYFSIAMLEAMLLECPLVASTHSSGVDVITAGADGWLADHNDPAALGNAVAWLVEMTPAAREEMGRRARDRVLQGYTWDNVAKRLLAVYSQTSTA